MASVSLPCGQFRAVLDPGICAKTGTPVDGLVTLRGVATPPWVTVLLLMTVVGYLLAHSNASRRFEVTVPYDRAVHQRWMSLRRTAQVLGVGGAVILAAAAFFLFSDSRVSGSWFLALVGLALVACGLVLGWINGRRNGIGVTVQQDCLVLERVHLAFAEAVSGRESHSAGRAVRK